ncbi:MAG: hypothetical protein P8170_07895 [Gemmatimonadota bacterium]
MSDLRIDYSDLHGLVDEGRQQSDDKKERRGRLRGLPLRVARRVLILIALATLPFFMLVRLGVFAYREWALGAWPALAVAVLATGLLLGLYAWLLGRKLGAGKAVRRILTRGAAAVAAAYVVYALVYVAGANVKSTEVRQEYGSLHPLLRVASSIVFLADPGSVITDAGRTEEDYWLMGLPVNEASLHFPQEDGFVHALDLRTRGRPEWSNLTLEFLFWAFGFHSLRHVGTADHLHVSLRPPRGR